MTGNRKKPLEFRGAPTRIGRFILFVFGGLFVLPGLIAFGLVVFGEVPADERLAQGYGGLVLVLAGLIVWAPAFSEVVNRIMQIEHPLIRPFARRPGASAFGMLISLMGLFPILAAVGIVPTGDSDWGAPRWVGGLAGGLFLVTGLYLLGSPVLDRGETRLRKYLLGFLPLVLVTGLAVIASWVAFGSGDRPFGVSAGSAWLTIYGLEIDAIVGRTVFGLGAVFLIVISAIGWWKYLRGKR